jgi:hypothetical protein
MSTKLKFKFKNLFGRGLVLFIPFAIGPAVCDASALLNDLTSPVDERQVITSTETVTKYLLFQDLSYNFGDGNDAEGGAIHFSGSATTLTFDAAMDFMNNLAKAIGESKIAGGGALYNDEDATTNFNHTAKFTGNRAESANGDVYGGAIDNYGTITFGANAFVYFEGNSAKTTAETGMARGGALYNGNVNATIRFNNSATFFGNRAESANGDAYGGAIHNLGAMDFNLGESHTVKFKDNFIKSGSEAEIKNDIYNGGTITITGSGVFELDGGISSNGAGTLKLSEDDSAANDSFAFDLGSGSVIQKTVTFATGSSVVVRLTIDRFDAEITEDKVDRADRGGKGGYFYINYEGEEGSMSGPFALEPRISKIPDSEGESFEYRYIYKHNSAAVNVTPTISNKAIASEDGRGLFWPSFRKNGEETVDPSIVVFKMIKTETIPDAHSSSQMAATVSSVQTIADTIMDVRLDSEGDSNGSLDAAREYGLLASANGKGSPNLTKSNNISSGLWSKIVTSFGKVRDMDAKTSGFGLALGFDHRLTGRLKLGLAYAVASNDLKSDSRTIKTATHIVSLYSRLDIIDNFYTNNMLAFGLGSDKDGSMKYDNSVVHFTSLWGYSLKTVDCGILSPEISIRYGKSHIDSLTVDRLDISKVDRHAFTATLGFRYRAPTLVKNLDLGFRVAYAREFGKGGDDFFTLKPQDSTLESYQLSNVGAKDDSALELGLGASYRAPKNIDVSLAYGGRYSDNASNNSFSLGIRWGF